jgi:hypothetical protein
VDIARIVETIVISRYLDRLAKPTVVPQLPNQQKTVPNSADYFENSPLEYAG